MAIKKSNQNKFLTIGFGPLPWVREGPNLTLADTYSFVYKTICCFKKKLGPMHKERSMVFQCKVPETLTGSRGDFKLVCLSFLDLRPLVP